MEQVSSEDDVFRCALCGTAESDASNLNAQTLQTNATVRCGHQFCNNCIDRELVRKREFPCPICQTPVKRVTLTVRSLDDVQCEKDTSWRRRVLKVFNQVQEDFPSLLEYNNYLEMVEDMIFSIVHEEPNAEECKAKIKEYEQAHKAEIVVRQSQRADYERSVQDRIAAEQRATEQGRREAVEMERAMLVHKKRFQQETNQVLLGEREEVSAEVQQAQMMGYRNELKRRGKAATQNYQSPQVREPPDGWKREAPLDRQRYQKRQAAGGGIPSTGSIASNERNWNETLQSLFAGMPKRPRLSQ